MTAKTELRENHLRVATPRSRARHAVACAVLVTATALSAPTAVAADDDPTGSQRSQVFGHADRVAGGGSPPPGVKRAAGQAQHVPGELIVKFRAGVSASGRARARSVVGAALERRLHPRGLELLTVRGGVAGAVRALERRPDVVYAEPNYIFRATATPDDPLFGQQWAMHNTGQTVWRQPGTADADIEAPGAWERAAGDSDVTVAVIDSGVAYDHPDLAGNMWSNPGETANSLDDDGNGFVDDVRGWDWVDGDNDPRDLSSHGTHVAGTVGAVGDNGRGVAGVAWDVSLMPLRVLDGAGLGTEADLIEAIRYATAKGVEVVNLSLGGPVDAEGLSEAIDAAPDTLFVVAAGNEGVHNDDPLTPTYPCSYPSTNLVCVAATDNTDSLAAFSNHGDVSVDLAAPGVGILSTVPSTTRLRFDGFEDGGGWTNRWVTGTRAPWGRVAYDGEGWIEDSPGTAYRNNAGSWVRTATPVDLTGRHGCRVDYWMYLDTEEDADGLRIETAPTKDGPWTTTSSWTGSTDGYWYTMSDYLDDGGRKLFVRFRLVSNDSIQGDGTAIDNVAVSCMDARAGDSYSRMDGTSMAAPHVSGAAAVLFAARPDADVQAVRTALLDGAMPIGTLHDRTVTGARLDLRSSLAVLAGDLPVVAFDRARYAVDESAEQATVTVHRSGDTSGETAVTYTVSDGTATADSDFAPSTGTLVFSAGETTATLTVDLLPDQDQEADETVALSLSSPSSPSSPSDGAVVGTRDAATLTVKDDDFSVVSFSRPSRTVAENAGTTLLTVTRSGNTAAPGSVPYARTAGSATPGRDFRLETGVLEFAAGQTTATIPVTVTNDAAREAAETLKVTLSPGDPWTRVGSSSTTTLTLAASDQRPDAWVSTGPGSGYVGNNVYNTSGVEQTRTVTARVGQTRTFYVRVYNDGNVTNRITVKGSAAAKGSRVRYFVGTTNVTTAMRSRAGYSVRLARGAFRLVEVRTTVLSTAAIGSLKPAKVTGTWLGDGTRSDLARAVVKVVR